MNTWAFLRQFVSHPGQTGAIRPSSKHLAKKIVKAAEIDANNHIVEIGPGTGIFTEHIHKTLTPDNRFFAIEINESFVRAARKRCPDVTVFHDSAVNVKNILDMQGMTHCDRVVSGLPWASFPEPLQTSLLDALLDVLSPGGRFVTFAYIQGLAMPAGRRFRKTLHQRFHRVGQTRVVWRNTPPALVYWADTAH